MSSKTYQESLVKLITPMEENGTLLHVSHQRHPQTGARFVTLVEAHVATLWRWDEEEHDLIFSSEMSRA